ncbi:Hypothetical predicted protein [Pelobates cultripes]|uniref:Uncharacterized protein n=1 Tax=Pelobates cultripes TaxID=61616 RepID=A0AAD1SK21_PELCU|nr:Hypothetical predicted protein [Pelobates cultripes]
MPRKPAIDNRILKETLKSYPGIFNDKGELKSASDPIWREVCSHSSFQKYTSEAKESGTSQGIFKPKQIHDYIFQNRYGLQTFLRMEFSSFLPQSNVTEIMEELWSDRSTTDEDSSEGVFVHTQGNEPTLLWQISIPYEKYLEIEPKTVIYNEGNCKKRRKVLKQNTWTATIADVLYKQHGIPCAFSFKRNKVRIGEDKTRKFITANGHCTECKAVVHISAEQEPDLGNPLILHVRAPDTRPIPHLKKNQLRGEKRRKLGEEMLKTLPSNWRREKLDSEITFGEKEPPNMPSLRICQDARQEAVDRMFGTPKLKDPVLSLSDEKYS